MPFDVRNVISPRNLEVLRRSGLHKLAAAMDDKPAPSMHNAIAAIASRAYEKRAEARVIARGIEALASLRGEKVANVWEALLSRSLVPAAGGAALMAIPELAKPGPTNTDEVMNKALLGGAMGLAGGGMWNLHKGMQANPAAAQSLAQTIAPGIR